jgi:MFS-type transporter involved in bile tolerance (Atg22 family)
MIHLDKDTQPEAASDFFGFQNVPKKASQWMGTILKGHIVDFL